MIALFEIQNRETKSMNLYKTSLRNKKKISNLLEDAILLLSIVYDLTKSDNKVVLKDDTSLELLNKLSNKTRTKVSNLSKDDIETLCVIWDDGWSTDVAVALLNYIYKKDIFMKYKKDYVAIEHNEF